MMFAYYLSIGMPSNEYWYGDVWLTQGYHKAYVIKKEAQNQMLWLQGLYNYQGVATALSGFSKHKGKQKDYLKEPIRITPLSEREKQEKVEQERLKIIKYFESMSKAANKERGSK